MTCKLYSWNVNGIRAILKKNFYEFMADHKPDILCLQEVKASLDQVELDLPGYDRYWYAADKKGYSGTAVFTKPKPLRVAYGLGLDEHDREGRVITLEFAKFFLVNVYTPNSGDQLGRLAYRTQVWDLAFLNYLRALEQQKPVVFCGDLNVAHKEIDLANPRTNQKSAGFTPEERAGFDNLAAHGFVDTFREFNKETGQYTWWSYRTAARTRNSGWRIDYFCVSASLQPALIEAAICPDVMGSDHCPVSLTLPSELVYT